MKDARKDLLDSIKPLIYRLKNPVWEGDYAFNPEVRLTEQDEQCAADALQALERLQASLETK